LQTLVGTLLFKYQAEAATTIKNKKFRDVVVIFLSLTKSCDNTSAIRFRQFNILLANYPVLASGVNAIRWLLLGNKEKISNNYFIEYSNKLTDWKINVMS
jgi:hypothetical protein